MVEEAQKIDTSALETPMWKFLRYFYLTYCAVLLATGAAGWASFWIIVVMGLAIDGIRWRFSPVRLLTDQKIIEAYRNKALDPKIIAGFDHWICKLPRKIAIFWCVYFVGFIILYIILPTALIYEYVSLFEPIYAFFEPAFKNIRVPASELRELGYQDTSLLVSHIFLLHMLTVVLLTIFCVYRGGIGNPAVIIRKQIEGNMPVSGQWSWSAERVQKVVFRLEILLPLLLLVQHLSRLTSCDEYTRAPFAPQCAEFHVFFPGIIHFIAFSMASVAYFYWLARNKLIAEAVSTQNIFEREVK